MSPTRSSAEIASRVGIAGGALGIVAEDLVPHIADVAQEQLQNVLVWTDADTTLLGVSTALPKNDPVLARRMTVLSAGIVPTSSILSQTALCRPGSVWIERWSNDVATVNVGGDATADEDVAALASVVIGETAPRALADRLALLVPGDRRNRVIRTSLRKNKVEVYELGVEAPPDVLDAITANAAALGVPDVQLRLLGSIHDIMARGKPVLLRARMHGGVIQPGITIVYSSQTLDHAFRAVNGLATRADSIARLGTLTGSLATEDVAAIELQLGAGDPLPMRLAFAL
ncbi:MAG TPA: hypothetical protein VGM90_17580 [Kofleriaceae bacterium]|jgi:hypothetical protein